MDENFVTSNFLYNLKEMDVEGRIRGTIRAPIRGNNVDNDLESKVNFQELSNPIIWRRPFCGFPPGQFPYFEFSPQMGRKICANIAGGEAWVTPLHFRFRQVVK